MRRPIFVLSALLIAASAANAATLTVTPDETSYEVGETITLSIVGDAEGASAFGIQGYLLFDRTLAGFVSMSQQPLTSFGGATPWLVGGALRNCEARSQYRPGCLVFNQILPIPGVSAPPDNLLIATLQLEALAPGVLDFSWETDTRSGLQLMFFGLSNAPGASVLVHNPEPGTGALLALGLLQLASLRGSIRRK
jgi:hypothetical protein